MIKLVATRVVVVVLRPVASLNVLRATAMATDVRTRGRCHPCDSKLGQNLVNIRVAYPTEIFSQYH